jgi:arylmalonate decarboxylase
MGINRRDVLAGCAATLAATGANAAAAPAQPLLGLILPPTARPVPDEAVTMYGSRLRFAVAGLGIPSMTPASFDAALERIPEAARELASAGANAIVLMGTSLSFYKGEAFNVQLRERVTGTTGLPATTMSNGVIEGLKAVGARRVAVATAYGDEVNGRLRAFLAEHGLEPLVITGLGLEAMTDVERVTQDELLAFCERVGKSAHGADSLLVSCGGLRTLELIAPLETSTGMPVISSTPHGLWAGARLLGLTGEAAGYGSLLSRRAAA